jgi:hypothetical protein
MKMCGLVVGVAGLALAGTALGQTGTGFTISDGDVFFTQVNSPTSGTGTVSGAAFRVNGATGLDHVFETWWWFRVEGDTREFALNNAAGTVAAGNTATTTWNMAGAAGGSPYAFSAVLTYTVTDTGENLGQVAQSMVITNTGSDAITLNLFQYTDFDVNGTASTDSATGGLDGITISDGPFTILYQGVGASAYQVTTFATLRGLLTNTTVDNLNNTGLPFGPGDFTGGFQWTLTLGAGESTTVMASMAVIPTPASLALLGLGGLAAARRRR